MLSKTKLALALGLAWGCCPAIAAALQAPSTADSTPVLSEITVSATRTERSVDKVANTVSVTPASKIEQGGARNLKDALRDELDVSVRAAPTRFTAAGPSTGRAGNEGVNIRGLEGNQVLMMVDGVRVPNSFSFGSFATGRGDFLDVDGIKTVEVLRGPASTQFGSDGLAGAVSFQTLEPSDLLKARQQHGGFARTSYASMDRSWAHTLGVASNNQQWQAMLLASYRTGEEGSNQGDNAEKNLNRTAPNPLDYQNRYVLGKVFLTLNAAQQIGLTVETQNRHQNTEVFSARSVAPLNATSTADLDTRDKIERSRWSLEHRYQDLNATWLQSAQTRLYWQDAKVSQFALEDRNSAADRTRNNHYHTTVRGFSTLLESNLSGALPQRLTYGIDWSKTQIIGVRDGTVPAFGDKFPSKPFPDTTYTLAGAFLQSEIEAGKLSILPALRFDHYKLAPSSTGYGGSGVAAPVTLSGQALTPRLGVVWQFAPAFAPYAQWAKGFRAPSPEQVNNGFTNLASGYTSVGNAKLQAEHANSIELGWRGRVAGVRYSVSAYHNRYQDFISQQVVGGAGTPSSPTVFQYINLAKARIYGTEVRAQWQIDKQWHAHAGMAYARGNTEVKGVKTALDTVAPRKAVVGLRYEAANWHGRATLTYSAAKDSRDISNTTAQFAPPSYTVLDLGFSWQAARNLSMHANVNNVFDSKYWRWSDVRGLAANSAIKDAYTAAPRNFHLSVRYDF